LTTDQANVVAFSGNSILSAAVDVSGLTFAGNTISTNFQTITVGGNNYLITGVTNCIDPLCALFHLLPLIDPDSSSAITITLDCSIFFFFSNFYSSYYCLLLYASIFYCYSSFSYG
jgi:hypothetical protein